MNGMSPRESFNVLKKGAPSDLSIYFLKENMIYSLSWSVVGQNMETGRTKTFRRSLYLIISVSLLSCKTKLSFYGNIDIEDLDKKPGEFCISILNDVSCPLTVEGSVNV